MIQLIDQSDPANLKFRCTLCRKEFTQPNFSLLDLHSTRRSADADKAKIPLCEPVAIPIPIVAAAPKAKASCAARRVVAPIEPTTSKRKVGRPHKVVTP